MIAIGINFINNLLKFDHLTRKNYHIVATIAVFDPLTLASDLETENWAIMFMTSTPLR